MSDKDYKAFIVEGEAREPLIIDNISKVFFMHANFKIITLPAGQNIYKQRVFILSAFPEFLLDYFGVKLWRTCVKHTGDLLKKKGCK